MKIRAFGGAAGFADGIFGNGTMAMSSGLASTISPTVLLHDCKKALKRNQRKSYDKADHLLDLVEHSGVSSC